MNPLPPLPTDLETAVEEIKKLRNQLIQTNEKWMKAIERRELDNRANKGTINSLQENIKEAKAVLRKSLLTQGSDLVADVEDAMEILE